MYEFSMQASAPQLISFVFFPLFVSSSRNALKDTKTLLPHVFVCWEINNFLLVYSINFQNFIWLSYIQLSYIYIIRNSFISYNFIFNIQTSSKSLFYWLLYIHCLIIEYRKLYQLYQFYFYFQKFKK